MTDTTVATPFADIFRTLGFSTAISPTPKRPRKTGCITKAVPKRVYVCSPYRGDVERNTKNAIRYARFVYDCGRHPIAPHLYYPLFLNDAVYEERADALSWGLDALAHCDEIWVFGDTFTGGMRGEIDCAKRLGIRTRFFTENCEEK